MSFHPEMSIKYASLSMSVQQGWTTPEKAIEILVKDLEAAKVDLRPGLEKLRQIFVRSEAMLRVIDGFLSAPKKEAPRSPPITITVRTLPR